MSDAPPPTLNNTASWYDFQLKELKRLILEDEDEEAEVRAAVYLMNPNVPIWHRSQFHLILCASHIPERVWHGEEAQRLLQIMMDEEPEFEDYQRQMSMAIRFTTNAEERSAPDVDEDEGDEQKKRSAPDVDEDDGNEQKKRRTPIPAIESAQRERQDAKRTEGVTNMRPEKDVAALSSSQHGYGPTPPTSSPGPLGRGRPSL